MSIITDNSSADLSAIPESSLADFVDVNGDSNGKVIEVNGTCYIVQETNSGSPQSITADQSHPDCDACESNPAPCSCPISSQQAQDLEDGTVQSVVGSDGNTYCRDYKVTFTNTKYVGSPIDCTTEACQDVGVVLWVRAKYTQTGNDTTCNWEYLCGGETDANGDPVNCGDYTTATLSLALDNDPDCYWEFSPGSGGKRREPTIEGAYEDGPTCSNFLSGGGGGFNYDRLTNVSVTCDNDPTCAEAPAPCSCPISQSDWDDLVDGVKDSVVGTNGVTYYRQYDITSTQTIYSDSSCSTSACSQTKTTRVSPTSKSNRCEWEGSESGFCGGGSGCDYRSYDWVSAHLRLDGANGQWLAGHDIDLFMAGDGGCFAEGDLVSDGTETLGTLAAADAAGSGYQDSACTSFTNTIVFGCDSCESLNSSIKGTSVSVSPVV